MHLLHQKTAPGIFSSPPQSGPAGAGNSPVDPTNMGASGSGISEFGTVYGNFPSGDFY